MTLAEHLSAGRTSNLDFLRLVLAACVIVSHAWPLALGPGTPEPLEQLTGRSLGGWAVLLFFFLSGLLVTRSAERKTMRAFWRARAKRIFPGLGVALLSTLALACASGAAPNVVDAAVWFLRAFTLLSIEHKIPGAFAGNPYPSVVNGPLWSLFHEVTAYGLCVLIVFSGLTRHALAVLGLVLATTAITYWGGSLPGRLAVFAPLFCAFVMGMAVYRLRYRIKVTPALIFVATLTALGLPGVWSIGGVCVATLAAVLCLPQIKLHADYSYGLYIYGWPVAQFVMHMLPNTGPGALAVLSLAATFPFAVFSWHFVEAPMMSRQPDQV
jgi:peptidoglycan/LPS O-acetylase OafA/YrhL